MGPSSVKLNRRMDIGLWLENYAQKRLTGKAKSWPFADAVRVELTTVELVPSGNSQYALQVAYAYEVKGETYGNTERRFFPNSSEAYAAETRVKQRGVRVRYNPGKLAESWIALD